MKRLFTLTMLLLLSLCPALCCAQSRKENRSLQLETKILGQRYCAMGEDVDALELRLQLRYTNVGNEKIILYRGIRLFYQIMVSRNEAEASARRFEFFTSSAWFYDRQPEKIDAPAPGRVFVVLPPGGVFQTERAMTIPVMREGRQLKEAIPSGDHILQLTFSTWYESKTLFETLRERWRKIGLLWSDAVMSKPVAFSVEMQRTVVACQ